MAKRKKKNRTARVKNRGQKPQERVEATPQTLSRLKPCPIVRLASTGAIGPQQEAAYREIENLKVKTFGFLSPKVIDLNRVRVQGGVESESDAERFAEAWGRYKGWLGHMRGIKDGPAIVQAIDDVIRGASLADIDEAKRKRNGWASNAVKAGLYEYTKLAGWM